jgi:VanZ family protein
MPDARPLPFPLIWLRTRRRRLTVIAFLCLVIYLAVLFTLTHLPKVPTPLTKADDKTLHFLAYFALACFTSVFGVLAFPRVPAMILWVVLVCGVIAAIDETTQPIFGRTADILDWRADVFGAMAAAVLLGLIRFAYRRFYLRRLEARD